MNVLDLAKHYRLIPWKPRKNIHDRSWPLIPWKDKRLTQAEVRAWLTVQPDADWSIIPEETIVLDLENKNGLDGRKDLEALARSHGVLWDQLTAGCAITATKSNGLHIWYRQPTGISLSGGFHLCPGVEVKAGNGGVHIPPSFGYRAITPLGPPDQLPILPEFLARLISDRQGIRGKATTQYRQERYGNGERRLMMCGMAGKLRSAGLSGPELYACLLAIRDSRCDDPETFTDDEVEGIANDYAKRPGNGTDLTIDAGRWIAQLLDRHKADMPNPAAQDGARLA